MYHSLPPSTLVGYISFIPNLSTGTVIAVGESFAFSIADVDCQYRCCKYYWFEVSAVAIGLKLEKEITSTKLMSELYQQQSYNRLFLLLPLPMSIIKA